MTPVLDSRLIWEEGRSCLNVDQTRLGCIAYNAGKKTISSRLLSLLLHVMAARFSSVEESCHLQLSQAKVVL